jgi:alpha-2-macroglobulin
MGDQVVTFKVRVKEAIGVAKVTVKAEAAGESATERIELQVRQPNLPVTEASEQLVAAGKEWSNAPAPLGIQGTNSAYLEISSIPPVDLGRRLQYLIDYPHGCLEQTTSKAFPQLFVARVMDVPDTWAQQARYNVEAALRKMVQFQRSDGSFNYWPGGNHYDTWTSIYAGHFMVEAERQGYAMPGQVKNNWLNFQKRLAREWNGSVRSGWAREQDQLAQAYRLYVLALAKSNEVGAMNRLREQRDLDLRTRWTLAAAYAHIGRVDAARQLVQDLVTSVPPYTEQAFTYGSELRDEALIAEALMAMGELEKAASVVQRLSRNLSSEAWYSTQSTAFGLLAVSRFAEKNPLGKGMQFTLTVNGKREERFSEKSIVRTELPVPDARARFSIENTGKTLLYARLVRTGTPLAGNEQARANGLDMTVEYSLPDGSVLDPARIEQGTDLVAVVTLHHPGMRGPLHQLALTQIFPSGWEIRNARLEGTEGSGNTSAYTYRDIRDDRVMTYFDLPKGKTLRYTVQLNAAYTGRYYLAGGHCEAMYDHTVNASGKGMWVEVVPAGGTRTAQR